MDTRPLLPNEGTLRAVNLSHAQIYALIDVIEEAAWYVGAERRDLEDAADKLRWHQAQIMQGQIRELLGELPATEDDL